MSCEIDQIYIYTTHKCAKSCATVREIKYLCKLKMKYLYHTWSRVFCPNSRKNLHHVRTMYSNIPVYHIMRRHAKLCARDWTFIHVPRHVPFETGAVGLPCETIWRQFLTPSKISCPSHFVFKIKKSLIDNKLPIWSKIAHRTSNLK